MASVNVLFWNIKGKESCLDPLAALVREHDIDLLLVAECPFDAAKVSGRLGNALPWVPHNSGNLKFFTSLNNFFVVNDQDSDHLVLARLQVGRTSLLLAGLHLESKRERSSNKQLDLADKHRFRITEQESFFGARTLIFGDFNLNPYDLAMTHPGRGFSAVATRYLAQRSRKRTVTERGQVLPRRYFYNPMWSFLGDFIPHTNQNKVPGTYWRSPHQPEDTHWNCLDGVLVSPEAVPYFDLSSLTVLTTATLATPPPTAPQPYALFGPTMNTTYSDHLPICFTLHNL